MRKLFAILGVIALAAVGTTPAAAQEAGQELTLTGCLAQETDDAEPEFVLRNLTGQDMEIDEMDLVPGEGVNLSPHVGHTVEVTGTVVAESEHGEMMEHEGEMEHEDEMEHEGEMALQVTSMTHISATCEEGDGARR